MMKQTLQTGLAILLSSMTVMAADSGSKEGASEKRSTERCVERNYDKEVPIKDGDYVRAPNGAVFKVEFGFKKRIPNEETLTALGIAPATITSISRDALDRFDDGGTLEEHKLLKVTVTSTESRVTKTITIPEGWMYVSHAIVSGKSPYNRGSHTYYVNRDSRSERVVSVSVTAKGRGRGGHVMGFPVGAKYYQTSTLKVVVKKRA